MKYIEKSPGPRKLKDWFNTAEFDENGKKINCRYTNIYADLKKIIAEDLLQDQGYICCYTGIRISYKTMHIEHLKPQSVSRRNGDHDDVAYHNMLAAYPKKDKCPFGARIRNDWYELEAFIHPLNRLCGTKFKFNREGCIQPSQQNDLCAHKTIEKLKLNHPLLDDMRKQAINEALFPDDTVLSEAQLRRIVENGFSIRDSQGRFPKFCFVIEQVAKEVLKQAERERKRKEVIQKAKRRGKRRKK